MVPAVTITVPGSNLICSPFVVSLTLFFELQHCLKSYMRGDEIAAGRTPFLHKKMIMGGRVEVDEPPKLEAHPITVVTLLGISTSKLLARMRCYG